MSAIAHVLKASGCEVQGSDRFETLATATLREVGIPVFIGHDASNVKDAQRVVYTRAVPDDNPELSSARKAGIPVIERAEMLGKLYELFSQRVSVTGTHGKTSTSAMLASILVKCGLDPTVLIGGHVPDIGGHARLGRSEIIVAEACEAYASFLHLRSSLALVTNVDKDHLDYYKTYDRVKQAFVDFLMNVDEDGVVLACADDATLMALRDRVRRKWQTYGYAEDATFRIIEVHRTDAGESFTVVGPQWREKVQLPLYGRHFVSNAAGALVAAVELGCDPRDAAAALSSFSGVGRRMELKGRAAGVTVVDDYAHHPTEIAATLAGAREQFAGRLTVVFQPHLFSRTADLLEDFTQALLPVDRLVVTNVYAAREDPESGRQADALFERLQKAGHTDVHYVPDLADVGRWLSESVIEGDVVMTMGAGNIYEAGEDLLALLGSKPATVQQR